MRKASRGTAIAVLAMGALALGLGLFFLLNPSLADESTRKGIPYPVLGGFSILAGAIFAVVGALELRKALR